MSDAEGFFTRWSRRKAARRVGDAPSRAAQDETPARDTKHAPAAREGATPSPARAEPPASRSSTTPRQPPTASVARGDALPLPTLADVEGLVPTSDFSRFVAPGVDASVQHAALKKLFADPHFNVMDGLDTYIDDYNTPNPIPPAMLERLLHTRAMRALDAQPPSADAAAAVPPAAGAEEAAFPDGANAPALPQSAAAGDDGAPPGPDTDEDTALRLQPDDAADAAGARPHRTGPRA